MASSGNIKKKYGSELKNKQNIVITAECILEIKMYRWLMIH